MTKVKTTKNPEERRAEAERLHETIATQVAELRDTGAWRRFLAFAQSFHRYSLGNLLLIQAQRPEATHVAGYRSWQARGRQVRKGERGIRIFGGRTVTTTETDEATGDETEATRLRFFPVSVFDISQTDPIDPEAEDPDSLAHLLTGDDETGIYDATAAYLTAQGWTVEREALDGGVNGHTRVDGSRAVVIHADLEPAQAAKTALHEAGHVLMHADALSEDDALADYVAHRGIYETEAESVAYIVAGVLGLDTSAYSIGYIAGWSECDPETVKATAARVLRCAHQLADALTSE